MTPGYKNFLSNQAQYQETINITFKDKRMKKLSNWLEGNISKILFYSLLINLLGYTFRFLLTCIKK